MEGVVGAKGRTSLPLFYLRMSWRQRLRLLFGGSLAVALEFDEADAFRVRNLPRILVHVEIVK